MLLMVLISETESAPPFTAALAGWIISVMFGVSFTITVIDATSVTHSVIMEQYSGTCPTAAPIPLSLIP